MQIRINIADDTPLADFNEFMDELGKVSKKYKYLISDRSLMFRNSQEKNKYMFENDTRIIE